MLRSQAFCTLLLKGLCVVGNGSHWAQLAVKFAASCTLLLQRLQYMLCVVAKAMQ